MDAKVAERVPSANVSVVTLFVNGERHDLLVKPEWSLYHVLHDMMGLTGTKQFCDRGACGSCTVILEGRPILSCMKLAIECDGLHVETIEGIAADHHPLIDAYVRNHTMQCGYCTPGFVVTAKALLDENADPTEEDIRDALGGNLCRCGSYPQHIPAVKEAARELRERGNQG